MCCKIYLTKLLKLLKVNILALDKKTKFFFQDIINIAICRNYAALNDIHHKWSGNLNFHSKHIAHTPNFS